MPAQKATRQSVKRYARNLSVRRTTRTAIVQARRAMTTGDADSAESVRLLDIAARKGVLHKNNASRRKARLAAALQKMEAS